MKTVQEVRSLVSKTESLSPEIQDQFTTFKGGLLNESSLTNRSKQLLTFFKPMLESTDWVPEGADPRFSKRAETTKKLMACHAMLHRLRPGVGRLAYEMKVFNEMTQSSVDLPQFVRQLLLTITRVYARIFTPELFGVLPLNQPYGRLNFKDFLYDNAYTGSTPNIAAGDRTDDITKYNPDFYKAPEGVQANRTKFKYSFINVNTQDNRVISEVTDQLMDDAMSVYGDNAQAELIAHNSREMARQVDRAMVTALVKNVPSYNTNTFTLQPTSNPNYATLDPVNQERYDTRLYRDGVLGTLHKIRVTRKYADDGNPEWALCGSSFAYNLNRLSMFIPYEVDKGREIRGNTAGLRDYGTLRGESLRYLVDVMLGQTVANAGIDTSTNGDNYCYFGRLPAEKNDVGLYWMPYIMLQPTRNLYDPETGVETIGMRSRWGVAQPDTGQSAASSQLADVYGLLKAQ